MATAIQRRRGTTTQHGSFTGLAGEITIDTTKNTIVVHDGSTAGGIPLATAAEVGALGGADITDVVAGAGLTGGASSGSATINVIGGDGITVSADAVAADQSYIRGSLSVTDAGGDGSLAYNNTSGVITYTGPSAAEVRAHLSAGTGVGFSGGEISIGQAVATTSDVTFADVVVSGDLTVSGTQTSVNTETLTVDDNLIVLNNNESGTPSQDAGIEVERGTSTNVKLQFDEGDDKWQFTNDGSTYNDLLTVTQVEALFSVTDAGGDGSLAYSNTTGVFTYTGPSAAEVRAHISGSTGIDVSSGAISIDSTVATLTGSQTLTNKTLTSPVINTGVSGSAILDSDTMSGASATTLASSESIKAYVDASILTKDNTDEITEGSTNLYFTNARADARIANAIDTDTAFASASDSLVPSQLAVKTYVDAQVDTADALSELTGDSDDITEGSTNLFFTNARAQGAISVTDAGGLGSLAYSSGTITYTGPADSDITGLISVTDAGGDGSLAYSSGEITYTGPSASETRAHFSGGTGITYDNSTGAITTTDADIVHDNLSGFVANEHIDHSTVSVVAGTGLTGGGTITEDRTLNVVGGDGITANANDMAVDSTVVRTSGTQSINGAKTFGDDIVISGNLTINGTQTTVSTETLAIEDNIIVLNDGTTGTPSENAGIQVDRGSSDDVFLNWDESGDRWQFTNDGSTYYNMLTESDVEGFFSVTDSGGDGSLTYSSGVFTYTGPSAAEVRAHFTGGTGVDISAGTITFDGSELSTSTTDGDGDHFVVVDTSNASRKLTKGSIAISGFNNDAGFTTNVGDITSVVAGTGLSGGATSGAATLNVAGLTVTELAAGSLQTSGESFSDDDTSLMTSAAIADKIEAYGYSTTVGDITSVVAGGGLSGGGTSGDVTISVSGLTTSEFAAGSLQISSESFTDNDATIMTAAAINDRIESFGYTTNVGDITGVTAGSGLTGGGSSGSVTLNADTGAVSNGASTLATGDQIYDFVTGLGYSTTTGTVTSVAVTTAAGLDGAATITGSGTIALSLDLSELTDMTDAVVGSEDELILLDNGAERRKLISEITLSDFNNDAGFTTNVGDITGVSVSGTGLSGGGSSGAVTITSNATSANTASAIVARDGSGNFSAGTITATATQAQYADLAEIYSADADYEPGTVVIFGGDAEVTECDDDADHRVAGVVSTDPAYLMNADADGVAIALKGRVPCKVTGDVEKGALIVTSSIKGHGMQANQTMPGTVIGKAIEAKKGDGEGVIEILVV